MSWENASCKHAHRATYFINFNEHNKNCILPPSLWSTWFGMAVTSSAGRRCSFELFCFFCRSQREEQRRKKDTKNHQQNVTEWHFSIFVFRLLNTTVTCTHWYNCLLQPLTRKQPENNARLYSLQLKMNILGNKCVGGDIELTVRTKSNIIN